MERREGNILAMLVMYSHLLKVLPDRYLLP